jgi:hypothetical protein
MGGVGDFLFGGSESGGFTGENVKSITDEQENFLDGLADLLAGQLRQGVSSYPGQITPGASGVQNQVFDLVSNLISSGGGQGQDILQNLMQPYDTSGIQISGVPDLSTLKSINFMGGEGQDALSKIFSAYDPTAATETWKTRLAPATEYFEKTLLPAAFEPYVGANAANSGAALRARGNTARQFGEQMTSDLADLIYQGEQQHTANQISTLPIEIQQMLNQANLGTNVANLERQLGLDPAELSLSKAGLDISNIGQRADIASLLEQLPLQLASTGLNVGNTQWQIPYLQGQEEYNKWVTEQPYNNPWLTQFANTVLSSNPVQPIVSGGTQSSGLFQDILAPLGAGFLSTETGAGKLMSLLGLIGD